MSGGSSAAGGVAGSGWRRLLPISSWLASYEKGYLAADLIAALTVWALLVPEAMAYASLAGMPPETGLYAALVAPFAYAVLGTSRQLNVGPSSTVAVLSFSVVAGLASTAGPGTFYAMTAALALLTGLLFVIAGIVRLGFLADFMSRPVLDGFIVGLAMTIAVGQLHKLFGIEETGDDFFGDIVALMANLDETVLATAAIGFSSLALLFVLGRAIPRIPAALLVTFLAIGATSVLDLTEQGVAVIGQIPAGLPSLAWPDLPFSQWMGLVPGALAVVVVGFAESVAAARTYARRHGYGIDADQEMIAIGAANAASGLVGSFVVAGSLSKSAAGDQAGQRTQLASVALTAAILVTVLFLTGLFESLPEATLGAIVIHAVWHLIDLREVSRYWSLRRDDFSAGLTALVGVLVLGIEAGLFVAIAVSLLLLLARATRPDWSVLGRGRDESSGEIAFRSVDAHPDAETIPGLVIIRFDSELFFANASVFADDVREAVAGAGPSPKVVLVDAESINDVDATALGVMADLRDELRAAGIELWFARLKDKVQATMSRAGGWQGLVTHPTVRAGVHAFEELPVEPPGRAAGPRALG